MAELWAEYKKLLNNKYFHLVFILVLTLVFTGEYFYKYLLLPNIGSWDGETHFSITKYYSENIFPNLNGWVPMWNMGMPWTTGYPPGLSYLLAILYRIFYFVDEIIVFKVLFIVLTFLFPIVFYLLLNKYNKIKYISFLSSIGVLLFLSNNTIPYILMGGLNLRGTFQVGLYPQFLSSFILLIWMYFFFNSASSKKAYFISLPIMSLVLLTNVHVMEVALIIAFVYILGYTALHKDKFLEIILKYIIYFLLIAGFTAFWVGPLINLSGTFLTLSTNNVHFFQLLAKVWPLFLFALIGGLISFKLRNLVFISIFLSGLICIFLGTFPVYLVLPNLPLQPNRLVSFGILFLGITSVLAIHLPSYLSDKVAVRTKLMLRYATLFFLVLLGFSSANLATNSVGGLKDVTKGELELIEFLGTRTDGRSMIEPSYEVVEYGLPGYVERPAQSYLSGLLGLYPEHETFWGVFRESSINMPFIQPTRNAFAAERKESFAVQCWLCMVNNPNPELALEFDQQKVEDHIKRIQFFGIKYLVVYGPKQFEKYSQFKSLEYLRAFDEWRVFRLIDTESKFVAPKYEPVLLFSELKNTERPIDSYDWLRINEEWLFYGNYDLIFAKANQEDLSLVEEELQDFESIIITYYKYSNLEAAYQNILEASKTKDIYLLQSADPIYEKISSLQKENENIHILNKTGDVRNDVGVWLKILTNNANKPVKSIDIKGDINSDGEIKILIDKPSKKEMEPNFILTKYSYSKWWEGKDVQIYMASPALILIKPTQDATTTLELKFETVENIYIVYLLTIFSAVLYFLMIFFFYYNRKAAIGFNRWEAKLFNIFSLITINLLRLVKSIFKTYIKFFKKYKFSLFLIIVTYAATYPYYINDFASPIIGDWDSTFHYSASVIYHNKIGIGNHGWVEQWNLGMPLPTGYTPFTYMYLSIMYRLFNGLFENIFIYKISFYIVLLLLPTLVYHLFKKVYKSNFLSAICGFLILILLTRINNYSFLTSNETLSFFTSDLTLKGIYTPFFLGTTLSLICIAFILRDFKSFRNYYISVVFAGLTLITNIHTFICLLIIAAIYLIFEYKSLIRLGIKNIILLAITFFTLISFWFLPLVTNSSYFLTNAIKNLSIDEFLRSIQPITLVILSINLGILITTIIFRKRLVHKNFYILTISGIIITLLSIIPLEGDLLKLPIQPNRIISTSFLLQYLAVIFVFNSLKPLLHWSFRRRQTLKTSILLILVLTILSNSIILVNQTQHVMYDVEVEDRLLLAYLKNLDSGRSLIENWTSENSRIALFPERDLIDISSNTAKTNIISSLIPLEAPNHTTIWGVFREASINTPFIQPVRNVFSKEDESYGVTCWLCYEYYNKSGTLVTEFYANDLKTQLNRLNIMGIKYLVIRTPEIKQYVKPTIGKDLKLLNKIGDWEIYETDYMETSTIKPTQTILAFTDLNNTYREVSNYDWLRINEEWLYDGQQKYYFVKAQNEFIDKSKDFQLFPKAIIFNYKYSNIETAYNILSDYAEKNMLFITEYNDPLFNLLIAAKNSNDKLNIFPVKRSGEVRSDIIDFLGYVEYLDKTTQTNKQNTTSLQYSLVKQSFFPYWEDINGGWVYMISPAEMLVINNSSPNLLYNPEISLLSFTINPKTLFYFSVLAPAIILIGINRKLLIVYLLKFISVLQQLPTKIRSKI